MFRRCHCFHSPLVLAEICLALETQHIGNRRRYFGHPVQPWRSQQCPAADFWLECALILLLLVFPAVSSPFFHSFAHFVQVLCNNFLDYAAFSEFVSIWLESALFLLFFQFLLSMSHSCRSFSRRSTRDPVFYPDAVFGAASAGSFCLTLDFLVLFFK